MYVGPTSLSSCTPQKSFLILKFASFSRKTYGKGVETPRPWDSVSPELSGQQPHSSFFSNLSPRPLSGEFAGPLLHLPIAPHCFLVLTGRSWVRSRPLSLKWLFSLARPLMHRAGRGLGQVFFLRLVFCNLRVFWESLLHGVHFSSVYTQRYVGKKPKTLDSLTLRGTLPFHYPPIPWPPASETPSHPPLHQVSGTICVFGKHKCPSTLS